MQILLPSKAIYIVLYYKMYFFPNLIIISALNLETKNRQVRNYMNYFKSIYFSIHDWHRILQYVDDRYRNWKYYSNQLSKPQLFSSDFLKFFCDTSNEIPHEKISLIIFRKCIKHIIELDSTFQHHTTLLLMHNVCSTLYS